MSSRKSSNELEAVTRLESNNNYILNTTPLLSSRIHTEAAIEAQQKDENIFLTNIGAEGEKKVSSQTLAPKETQQTITKHQKFNKSTIDGNSFPHLLIFRFLKHCSSLI